MRINLFTLKVLKAIKYLDPIGRKPKLPKKLNQAQKISIGIFFKVLKSEKTELYYNLLTEECYLSNNDLNVHIFIEDKNIKVINSIYGYDIEIDYQTEKYLVRKFEIEQNKRRIKFKNNIVSKTENQLIQTYNKISNHLP
jgi:hypothetical protein